VSAGNRSVIKSATREPYEGAQKSFTTRFYVDQTSQNISSTTERITGVLKSEKIGFDGWSEVKGINYDESSYKPINLQS